MIWMDKLYGWMDDMDDDMDGSMIWMDDMDG